MATSSAMNTSNQYIKYTISVTHNSQSIADNTSNVTVKVRFYRTNTGYTSYGTGTVYCKINGTQYSASVTPNDKITNSGIVLFSKTLNISHGSDGKKTLACSAWIDHDVVTSNEQSYSQELPTIYRASAPTVCTVSGGLLSDITMGDTVYIYTNRKSSSFTHTIKYDFGTIIKGATIGTGVGPSYAWKVPDLAQYCNNALSGKVTITCITYNGSTKVGEEKCEVTAKVPEATTPVFTNGDVIIRYGNPIATNAKSTNFTHLITYEFNGATGNVNNDPTRGGIVWWTPSELAGRITSASGDGTITCITYNGTAEVGRRTVKFKAVVPNEEYFQPKVTEFNISPTGGLPSVFDGFYVQGKTGVQASFTASSDYSEIESYKLTVDGINYIGSPAASEAFTRGGIFTVTGTVTDKRGFSTVMSQDVTVYSYSVPHIDPCNGHSSIVCERSDQDGTYDDAGTHLHVKGKRVYSPFLSNAVDINFCAVKYQYKAQGGGWSSEKVLMPEKPNNTDDFDVVVSLDDVELSAEQSYSVRLIVTDTIGSSNTYEFTIPTADVTLHLGKGGYGVAVGKYSAAGKDKRMFESAWDAYFEKGVYAYHIAPIGSYDGEDFNDLIYQTGYYASNSSPSTSCSNYPDSKTGVLEVISHITKNATTGNEWGFAYQTYRTHDGLIYTRSYMSDNGWTPWAKIATT